MPKISFLMPAHNEDKVIGTALNQLQTIAGPDIEVLVGLDGCTDGTKDVVSCYDFVSYVELEERGGKPAVLQRLIDLAQGEIIIIHDADWRFVCDRDGIDALICEFQDPKLGGVILPPHNIPFPEMRAEIQCKGFAGAGLGVLLLWEYLLKTQTKHVDGKLYADADKIVYPFTVNIFRRGVISSATTAADDFERFMLLIAAEYELHIFNDRLLPYFEITDKMLSFSDHFRQRVRNHIARAQLASRVKLKIDARGFYIPFTWYCLKSASRVGYGDFFLVLRWYLVILLAFARTRLFLLKGIPDAREAWTHRLTRHATE